MPTIEIDISKTDRVAEILNNLKQGLQGVFQSDLYRQYLKTQSKFHNYSVNNCLLIALQKPDASRIAGYTSWQRQFGRQVKKGEKGIKILCPVPIKSTKEEQKITEEDKETAKDDEIVTIRYKIGNTYSF